jgi:predicted transcriptional regulator
MKDENDPPSGRFSYDGLQRAFHERARLGIMTSLISEPEGLAFADLKELCALSDGNLNRHLEVLKEARFVKIEKSGAGRGSRSVCNVTTLGHTKFLEYLSELERVIQDATGATKKVSGTVLGQ